MGHGATGGPQLGKTVVTLGDEITMSGAATDKVSRTIVAGIWVAFFEECQQWSRGQGFGEYLQKQGIAPEAVGCESLESCNMTDLTTINVSSKMAHRWKR